MSRKSRKSLCNISRKVLGIKCHENLKIKISREFNVAKCWERGIICLKDALGWTKIIECVTTT